MIIFIFFKLFLIGFKHVFIYYGEYSIYYTYRGISKYLFTPIIKTNKDNIKSFKITYNLKEGSL